MRASVFAFISPIMMAGIITIVKTQDIVVYLNDIAGGDGGLS